MQPKRKDYASHLATESAFAAETLEGLARRPKTLSCKWFYDENGSRLFEQITATPEYYPTRVETRLLRSMVAELGAFIPQLGVVVEPGSGSSIKTRILLQSQPQLQRYIPIDISEEFLFYAAVQLQRDFPRLKISPLVADFTLPMEPLLLDQQLPRLMFFPGSTIGNFAPPDARQLLCNFHRLAGSKAWLLIGVDMTQDERKLLAAYDDAAGITAQFNKNILLRANRELGADFDLGSFRHHVIFDRSRSRVEMHLQSTRVQQVHIGGQVFSFGQGETIHTENCYKYSREDFEAFAGECGWQPVQVWQDRQESDFALFLLKA